MAEDFSKESQEEAALVLHRLGVKPINDVSHGLKSPANPPSSGSGSSTSGSGSSGTSGSSGGSGNSSSGGNEPPGNSSPPGEGSSNSPYSRLLPFGGGMNWKDMTPARWVILVAIIITALSTVFLVLWRTSPAGVALQKEEIINDRLKIELDVEKERTKRVRLLGNQPAPASAAVPSATPIVTTSCTILPATVAGTPNSPIRLEVGKCYVREQPTDPKHDGAWVTFETAPRSIEMSPGAGFQFDEPKFANDGTGRADWINPCIGASTTSCLSYLAGKAQAGTTLLFRNRGHVQFNM